MMIKNIKKFLQTTQKKIPVKLRNKYAAALIAGSICALAFAPFHFFIAAIFSISGLFYLLENKTDTGKEAFKIGLIYGFGYFLAGIYWICISLLVDPVKFAWLIPFCLTIIPGVLALYFAGLAYGYKKITAHYKFDNYQKIIIFATLWIIAEILRSYLLSGFPWNLLGYSFLFSNHFAQSASIFGVYGLSFFAVLIALSPFLLYKTNRPNKIFAIILTAIIFANFIFGFYRLHTTQLITHDETKLRLVQANITQSLKWDPTQKYRNFLQHIAMSNEVENADVKAVIWSETSVPYAIDGQSHDLLDLLNRATSNNSVLITGGLRIEYTDASRMEIKDVWNSVFTINKAGIENYYDKSHLVPFGEYVPFANLLPFIEKITEGAKGFSLGQGPQTLQTAHFSYSPLICYEVIFPNNIIDKNNRPDLLVNVTNDSWFGTSSGPYQHFDAAKMRAIEYGISLARVANSGISGYIDPLGNVVNKINLNEKAVIDVSLVEKIPETIFSRFANWPLLALVLASLSLLFLSPKKRRKK